MTSGEHPNDFVHSDQPPVPQEKIAQILASLLGPFRDPEQPGEWVVSTPAEVVEELIRRIKGFTGIYGHDDRCYFDMESFWHLSGSEKYMTHVKVRHYGDDQGKIY